MVGIVYATRREADPFLELVAAEMLANQPIQLFQTATGHSPGHIVAISGMGKVAATRAAVHLVLAHHVSVLVNAGLAGLLCRSRCWPLGHLLCISSAVEGDCDRFGKSESPVPCSRKWFTHLETARLVTSDRPVFQDDQRENLSAIGELADMEGAAVARVAQWYGASCALIKGVSDNADGAGRQDIQRHIDRVSRAIAEALFMELRRYHPDEQP
jgi:adenosylhomocysteine nucleosidase